MKYAVIGGGLIAVLAVLAALFLFSDNGAVPPWFDPPPAPAPAPAVGGNTTPVQQAPPVPVAPPPAQPAPEPPKAEDTTPRKPTRNSVLSLLPKECRSIDWEVAHCDTTIKECWGELAEAEQLSTCDSPLTQAGCRRIRVCLKLPPEGVGPGGRP